MTSSGLIMPRSSDMIRNRLKIGSVPSTVAVPSPSGDLAQEGVPVLPEPTVRLQRGCESTGRLDLDSCRSGRQALPEVDMS